MPSGFGREHFRPAGSHSRPPGSGNLTGGGVPFGTYVNLRGVDCRLFLFSKIFDSIDERSEKEPSRQVFDWVQSPRRLLSSFQRVCYPSVAELGRIVGHDETNDRQQAEGKQCFPLYVMIDGIGKPYCVECGQTKGYSEEPFSVSIYDARKVGNGVVHAYPDKNTFNGNQRKECPVVLKPTASNNLPPSIIDSNQKPAAHGGNEDHDVNRVEVDHRASENRKKVRQRAGLLLITGLVLSTFIAPFNLHLAGFLADSCICGAFGMIIADRMLGRAQL